MPIRTGHTPSTPLRMLPMLTICHCTVHAGSICVRRHANWGFMQLYVDSACFCRRLYLAPSMLPETLGGNGACTRCAHPPRHAHPRTAMRSPAQPLAERAGNRDVTMHCMLTAPHANTILHRAVVALRSRCTTLHHAALHNANAGVRRDV